MESKEYTREQLIAREIYSYFEIFDIPVSVFSVDGNLFRWAILGDYINSKEKFKKACKLRKILEFYSGVEINDLSPFMGSNNYLVWDKYEEEKYRANRERNRYRQMGNN